MLHPGLASITFRQLSPREIVALAAEAGLASIEWSGEVHVPHGDLSRAREARQLTLDHGLRVAAYGSCYRAGEIEAARASFAAVLDTAKALGASTLRVWSGARGSGEADESYRHRVASDLRRMAELADPYGMTLSTEFHAQTLTDSAAAAKELLETLAHPNLRSYWEPQTGHPVETGLEEIAQLSPWLTHLHVFHRLAGGQRAPLAMGCANWGRYFEAIRRAPGEHDALLERVHNDTPAAFLRDAEVLKELLDTGWNVTSPPCFCPDFC